MSAVDTDWFIAPEKDAKKIARVVMDDAGEFDAWPNVHLPLGEMELRTLWTAMRGRKVKASESVAAELVFESPNGELFVIKVEPVLGEGRRNSGRGCREGCRGLGEGRVLRRLLEVRTCGTR